MIAQFNQSIEVTPCKSQREEVDVGTGSLDSSTRSFPRIPDDPDRDSVGRSTTTTRYSATTTTSRGAREQRSGGEHMFHQQVSARTCKLVGTFLRIRVYNLWPYKSYLLVS